MKKSWIILMVSAMMMLTWSCGPKTNLKGKPVTDIAGRIVPVPENPQKIVAIGPGGLRLVAYLGALDKVSGVEAFEKKNFKGRVYRYGFPQADTLPVIGPGGPQSINTMPDVEAVLKTGAQLIIASHMKKDMADKLQAKAGIAVFVVSYGPRFATITPDFFKSLNLLGKILGKEQRAAEIEKFYQDFNKDIETRVMAAEKTGVKKLLVYVGAVGYRGAQGITSTDPMFLPLMSLKTNDVASKHSPKEHIFLDKEKLLKDNPEIIFVDGLGLKMVKEDFSKNKDFYASLGAFQNKKVYLQLPFNFYTTNLGTSMVDTYLAGKILYPTQFKDVEIKKKAGEIYTFLLGKDFYPQVVTDFGDPEKPLNFSK